MASISDQAVFRNIRSCVPHALKH